jgi:hypothetical protein
MFADIDDVRAHGRDERIGVKEFYQGLEFMYRFIKALSAEGVPCSSVYHEQYFDGLLDETIASRGFRRLFSAERLKAYRDSSGN